MANALDKLIANPQREYGGPRASNRFAYQRDWTFCLLLKLHLGSDDYLVLCDYHDDLLVLNHSTAPTKVEFFQIKTAATKRWTIAGLLAQKPGASGPLPSVLGKLYRHRLSFPAEVLTLNFVSNLYLSVELASTPPSDSRIQFVATDLDAKELAKVKAALRAELALGSDPILDAQMVFHVSSLSLQDHSTHAKGALVDYLAGRDPTRDYPILALYRSLADEIQRRSDVEREFTAVVDLVATKGFSRAAFEKVLASCLAEADGNDPRKVEQELNTQLTSEGVPFGDRRAICRALAQFGIERMDSSRADLVKWTSIARSYQDSHLPQYAGTLWDFILLGKEHMKAKDASRAFSDEYIAAIVAWELLTHDR